MVFSSFVQQRWVGQDIYHELGPP